MNTCPHDVKLNEHCEGCLGDERDGWKHKPWFVFDTETTGLDVETDRIVQFGGLWVHNGEMTDRRLVTLNPGVNIPEGASRVHGITNEKVSDAPTFADIFPRVLGHFAKAEVVVTYNGARFDWPLLVNEAKRLGGTAEFDLHEATAETLFVDVLVQVKRNTIGRFWKGRGRHRLGAVAERMAITLPPGMRPHRADADAFVTGQILWITRDKLPHTALECAELLADRAKEQQKNYEKWRAEQAAAQGNTP